MKTFLYTFKNFPYTLDISNKDQIFKFHKLKTDIGIFNKLIEVSNPQIILGFAKSTTNKSFFETKAVNIFNSSKKIDLSGKDEYLLDYPPKGFENISINENYTDSFCNWTMYNISKLLLNKFKLQFIHIAKNDIENLNKYITILKKTNI